MQLASDRIWSFQISFFHLVICIQISSVALHHLIIFLVPNNIPLSECITVYSLAEGHLYCFWVLTILNKAFRYLSVWRLFCGNSCSVPLGKYQQAHLLVRIVRVGLVFWQLNCFPERLYHCAFTSATNDNSCYSLFLLPVASIMDSNKYVVWHLTLNCISLMTDGRELRIIDVFGVVVHYQLFWKYFLQAVTQLFIL